MEKVEGLGRYFGCHGLGGRIDCDHFQFRHDHLADPEIQVRMLQRQ